jgi:hypothetical protein
MIMDKKKCIKKMREEGYPKKKKKKKEDEKVELPLSKGS